MVHRHRTEEIRLGRAILRYAISYLRLPCYCRRAGVAIRMMEMPRKVERRWGRAIPLRAGQDHALHGFALRCLNLMVLIG